MKIGITSDCSSGLEYFPHKNNIKITRTTINFGKEVLIDGLDITADEFYERLKNSDIVPTTSAPSPGEIIRQVEAWKHEGCTDVIHVPIAFVLSSYGVNLKNLADEMFPDIRLHVLNPKTAAIMEGYIAYYAEILAKKSYSVEQIFIECEKLRNNIKTFFVVDDLKYLVKNGRLSSAAGIIGSLMKIKPVLKIDEEGKIIPFEKVRTHKKALERAIELIISENSKYRNVVYIVLHTGRKSDAITMSKIIESRAKNVLRVEISTVTPTVGAHIGYGILGFSSIIVDDLLEEI